MYTNVSSFTFAPPIIPLIYVPGHDLNSNVSLNLDASLFHSLNGCTGNSKIACTINKNSAKLMSNSQYPSSPHTYNNLIYCNKLNNGCCLSIDSVNVNK